MTITKLEKQFIKELINTTTEIRSEIINRFRRIYNREPNDEEIFDLFSTDTDNELYAKYDQDDLQNEEYDKGYIAGLEFAINTFKKILNKKQ